MVKLNASGSDLAYSTYLGGSDYDEGDGIAVDAAGNAYVTGYTRSVDFPTTAGALDAPLLNGNDNVFVAKLNACGSDLAFSTYLGGSDDNDFGNGIAVDAAGNAYVTGLTSSSDFPITAGAFDPVFDNHDGDAFVAKISGLAESPTAVVEPSSVVITGSSATFSVTYSDPDDVVMWSSIDGNNIRVTGPAGFNQLASLVSIDSTTDGSPLVATYQITAPGGAWGTENAGTYTATMQANQVSDTHNNFVAAGTLGSFDVGSTDTTPPTAVADPESIVIGTSTADVFRDLQRPGRCRIAVLDRRQRHSHDRARRLRPACFAGER